MKKRDREHQFVSERLSAYLDEELASRERTRVEAHLSTCGQCRADLRTLRWTKRLLRETPAVRVPRAFVVREADVVARRPVRRRVSRFAAQWATAVVALLLVLVLGGDLLTSGQLRMAGRSAPQAEMAWSTVKTVVVAKEAEAAPEGTAAPVAAEEAEAAPQGTAAPVAAKEAEVGATQAARQVVVTEVVEDKAVKRQGVEPEAERPVKPGEDEVQVAPMVSPSPGEPAKESQVDQEAGGIGATGVTTPTAAPQAMLVAPETTTPTLNAEGENQVLRGDTPTAVPPEEKGYVAEPSAPPPPVRSLLGARGWWRAVEVILGVALVGLVVAVVWMRRRG